MTQLNKQGHPRILNYILWDGQTPLHSIDFITSPNPPLIGEDIYDHRGRKIEGNLKGERDDSICIKRIFQEDYENRLLLLKIQWINNDDTIRCEKIKKIRLSDAQWESRFRKQRERIMDDLKGRAKKYNAGHYIDILYAYFKEEKQDFVETGSLIFAGAIQETLVKDISGMSMNEQQEIGTVKAILNESLDGVNKVYETLIFLTTL